MTSYADGTKVYANFGDTPFKSGEIQIAALGHVMVPGSYNSSYAAWRDDNFTPAEVAAGAGDPDAAGTADGMSNFTKYAYGIPNPKLPSTPNWTTNASSTNGLEFSFLRARPELNYRVQTSTDLIIWNDFVVNPGNSGNQVSVTVPVAAGERKKFGRLIVGD